MFAPNSNTSIDNNLLVSTSNQQFSHFVTPNQQNPNYSFFNFPSHFLDHDDFFLDNNNVLPYQSPPPTTTRVIESPSEQPSVPEKEIKAKGKGKRKRTVIRRTGKKDRHSKIHTAHGPRDRRMRLSLQIARKFFDLQDMLGFDKASKTIEWLFNKSKAAIKDLAERSCTTILPSSPSSNDGANNTNINNCVKSNNKQRKNKSGLFQKKENREKARARARERTKEKLIMMQKQGSDSNVVNTTNEQNPSENNNNIEVNEYGFSHNNGQLPLEEQMASVGIIEKFFTTSIFDFDHNAVHQDRGLSRPCDSIMIRSTNAIGFDDFAASWVTGNERISGAEFESSSANCAFMGRPFNCN